MAKEIPILFSTPMVQAVLEGRKTMTRRVINPQPLVHNDVIKMPIAIDEYTRKIKAYAKKGYTQLYTDGPLTGMIGPLAKWQPGDVLWVRESYMPYQPGRPFIYKAELTPEQLASGAFKFKPSIHMPKYCSRIWLEVTEVRAERLQDITEDDAKAEGVHFYGWDDPAQDDYKNYLADTHDDWGLCYAKESFETLWCKINGHQSWTPNPWVWVVSFKVLSTTGKLPRETSETCTS